MILHDVCIYGSAAPKHIHIQHGFIKTISSGRKEFDNVKEEMRLEMQGAVVLPGFINSHDHLDFNSFPQLGNQHYSNYTAWGKDIHAANAAVIKAVQQIPLSLRIQWGLYKNLLNGFTTVINHGEKLSVDNELANVFQDCYSLHSPAFEKYWPVKLNRPFRNKKPFVMHIGEGTDAAAHAEVGTVRKRNYFRRKIVAVHGVAMDAAQAAGFEGLVWCPASNFFLLNATAAINELKQKITIVFGTDSTLTAPWLVAAHFDAALQAGMVNEKDLLDMLTAVPARLWGMGDRGFIAEGMRADIVVVKEGAAIFNNYQCEMVMNNGEIRMVASSYADQWKGMALNKFDRIIFNGRLVYVKSGITELVAQLLSCYPAAEIPFTIA